jgi:RNA polymerase sigma factor (sigma-70 family)
MRTDAELLTSYARTRDEAAFAELARRHGSMVYRVALRILRDPHEAEDAAQAAFTVLAIKAGSVGGRGDLAAWLHGVARRVALRSLRARARRSGRSTTSWPRCPAASGWR